jgi:hypothetical protein
MFASLQEDNQNIIQLHSFKSISDLLQQKLERVAYNKIWKKIVTNHDLCISRKIVAFVG